jgi:glutathione S-transferase
VEPNLKRQWDFMESELAQHKWFAGAEFSAADIQMSFPVEAAAQRGGLDSRWPNLQRFVKRIRARPAYKRAIKAGGPYSFAED